MKKRQMVTVVVHRDGELESKTYRLSASTFRFLKLSALVLAVLVVVGAAVYTPIARTAQRVPGMNREMEGLRAENEQVRQLARTLEELEGRYDQVRAALGANLITPDEDFQAVDSFRAHAIHAALPNHVATVVGPSLPLAWPLDSTNHPGVVTRGQIPEGRVEDSHPGIDIAARSGTPIRASGGGLVAEAGYDAEYGYYVLLNHPDGYQTLYGHASRLLISAGDSVNMSQVIALVGSTGRSTAPHLHFEKRRGDQLVDPLVALNRES